VLASCQVISEGTDVPAVAGAIMLRPTKSLALALQQMGRALRPKPGDNTCHILDHVGVVREHGLPQTDRDWTLEGRPRRGKKKDEAAPVRQCTSCWAWVEASARTCPYCGAAKPVKPRAALDETGGELVEITEAKAARKREEWSASSFEQLLKIGRDRGYKNPAFWARKKIEGRNARRRRHG
jgi:superfamily II DNA or RNA helicase